MTNSAAGFASLFRWVEATDFLIALCVDEASELAKASVINRALFLHSFRDLREAATRRQHRLLSVAFFGTFTDCQRAQRGETGAVRVRI